MQSFFSQFGTLNSAIGPCVRFACARESNAQNLSDHCITYLRCNVNFDRSITINKDTRIIEWENFTPHSLKISKHQIQC